MDEDGKLESFALFTGDDDEETASAYLDLAGQMILERRYPLTADRTGLEVPARYDGLQVELAVALWARRGAEGEIEHDENGVARKYEGIGRYLARVVPCIGYEDGAR